MIVRRPRELETNAAAFLQVIVRNADGIIIVDRNGIVRFANPAAGALFGRKAEDFVGKAFEFPIVEGQTTELDIPRPGSRERAAVEMRVSLTEWEGASAYIASLRDVTKFKKTARSLLAANQKLKELQEIDRLKSTFISNVSHELRTPLTVIISGADNLLDGLFGALTGVQGKWVKKIQTNAQRLQDLVKDILDLSKLESGKLDLKSEMMDMAAVIEKLTANLQPLAEQKKLSLTYDVGNKLPPVWASRSRLEQVLTNLVTNAVKFTPEGGRITILAEREKDALWVTVADTGIGVAPENRELIFEPFRQVEGADPSPTRGIGLGLAICAEIIAQHKGRIWVESEPGNGSRFIFRIPVDFRKLAPAASSRVRTVCVIDDDPGICDLVSVVLSKKGYDISSIKDGEEAIRTIRDKARSMNVIFLDLMMPGVNGAELLKLIRETRPEAKVAILTAYPESDLSKECREQSSMVITKPFDIERIQEAAERLFGDLEKDRA